MASSGCARPRFNKAGRVNKRYRANRRRVCRYRYRYFAVPTDAICGRCGGVLLEEGVDGGLGVYEGLDRSVVRLLQFRSGHFGIDTVVTPDGNGSEKAELV